MYTEVQFDDTIEHLSKMAGQRILCNLSFIHDHDQLRIKQLECTSKVTNYNKNIFET